MNCLILAAGHGSRLRKIGPSKPLVEILGVPLIERVVRAAIAGGATEFHVVTGHRADGVEAFLADLSSRVDASINPVRLDVWDLPNGFSVIAGAERIAGEYLLLMADHLFDPDILRRLCHAPGTEGVRLAVDHDLANPFVDLDDVTRVATGPQDSIVRIGKMLKNYDAFDTGLFRATPALRVAIVEAIKAGKSGSLSDGVQRLADEGRASTIDVRGAWWADVDDERSHSSVEAWLKRHEDLPDAHPEL